MIYEFQVQYVKIDRNGNDRSVKENFVTENFESFADVEAFAMNYFCDFPNLDVTAIKRSKVKEIVNARSTDEDKLWMAEVQDVFVDDEGNEKYTKYKMLLYADTFDKAKAFMSEYLAQGYNMQLISIKLTSFVDVLK